MPTVTVPKTWSDGEVLEAADLNANFNALTTALNGGLGADNLSTPYALFATTHRIETALNSGGTASATFRYKVPSGRTLTLVEVQAAYEDEASTSATAEFQATINGSSVLSSVLAMNTPDTVYTTTSFLVSTATSGQVVTGTVTATAAVNISNFTIVLWWKSSITA